MNQKIVLFILLGMILGCSSKTEPFEIEGVMYYPTEIGHFVSYDVSQTVYALQSTPQTTHYQIKERITGIFKEAENGNPTVYQVSRFRRNSASDGWGLVSIGTFRKDNQRVIKTEAGMPYVVLTFPIRAGATWNGNTFNNLGRQDYEMTDLGQIYSSENTNLVFEKTLTVREAQDSSAVEKNASQAIYAKNVGLIYRISENYVYCQTANCFGQEIIESGEKIEQKMIDFGIE